MTNETKMALKRTAQFALMGEYGFAPNLTEITLLEATSDRTYVLFEVHGHEYSFRNNTKEWGVTLEKIS